jgi:CBS domain-containing protein
LETDNAEFIEQLKQFKNKEYISPTSQVSDEIMYPEGQFRIFINFFEWMDLTPITVEPDFPLLNLIEMFKKLGLRHVLVLNEGTLALANSKFNEIWPPLGSLLGIITKKDVISSLEKKVHQKNQFVLREMNAQTLSYFPQLENLDEK